MAYIDLKVATNAIGNIDTLKAYGDKDDIVEQAISILDNLPAADVVEVKHGKWISTYHHGKFTGGKCSVCGKFKKTYNIVKLHKSYRFCHKCGAKMDGKE